MKLPDYQQPCIPVTPTHIVKGQPLKEVLNDTAIYYLAKNLALVWPAFDPERFAINAVRGLDKLSLMARANHIATALESHLPDDYQEATQVLLNSLPKLTPNNNDINCTALFFLPYSAYWAQVGTSKKMAFGAHCFDTSMAALKELTKHFSAEFAIRPFINYQQDKTLHVVNSWLRDENHHVRRLCSEGLRPKLPWGIRLQAFINDPTPLIPILTHLKDDPSLYVRRSVANHLGDIAKDHPDLVFDLCQQWLSKANNELKWLIRHAVRYYAKADHPRALQLRKLAK